ncbi:hypothetical protein LTR56_015814 [Elasticomyces elasticus]|nr:hypothetical protein LTR56_015814 [Elasticomyces elasticus]KAK3644098.1 hypothetical protein LTR22_015420 [Elasticomyces elasticus]KAK4922021.1 hypothetical protein LTR49_010606 [Elasticomyces elasticus]KAK5768798.1 hypothetical protein LTS12_000858 [Elasticomyces elasticus]
MASPLVNTPTDIMFLVFDLLTVADLCSFRLICHWTQDQSHKCFASRAYKRIRIHNKEDNALLRLARVLYENTSLASMVHTLSIQWKESVPQSPFVGANTPKWMTTPMLASVPQLKKLELNGMCSLKVMFGPRFCLQNAPDDDEESVDIVAPMPVRPMLETLSFATAYISHRNLKAIIRLVSPILTDLRLQDVECYEGGWIDTLRDIQDATTNLTSLRLSGLREDIARRTWYNHDQDPSAGWETLFTCQAEGDSFSKAIEGQDGVETLSLRERTASMIGPEAIKLGLDMIAEYAVLRQRLTGRRPRELCGFCFFSDAPP